MDYIEEIKSLKLQLSNTKHINVSICNEIDEKNEFIISLKSVVSNKDIELESLLSENENFIGMISRLRFELSKLDKENTENKNEIHIADDDFIKQGQEIDKLRSELIDLHKINIGMQWDKTTAKIDSDLKIAWLKIDLKSAHNMENYYRNKWYVK